MKLIKLTLKLLLAHLLLLTMFSVWLYTTESGANWTWQQLKKYAPAELTINQLNGRLSDKLFIDKVSWQDKNQQLHIESLALNCDWLAMVFNHLQCHTIAINNIKHQLNEASSAPTNGTQLNPLPELTSSFEIEIQHLNLIQYQQYSLAQNIELGENSSPKLSLSQLSLNQLHLKSSLFSLNNLSFILSDGNINYNVALKGSLQPSGLWPHDLMLSVNADQLNMTLGSSGSFTQGADFTLLTNKQLIIKASGQWYWRDGLQVTKGLISLTEQLDLTPIAGLTVAQFNADFNLQWPVLNATIDSVASWQHIQHFKAHAKLNLANLADWQQDTSAEVKLDGQIPVQLLVQLEQKLAQSGIPPAKKTTQALPLNAKLAVGITQGEVKLTAVSAPFEGLKLEVNAKAKFENLGLNQLNLEGKIVANSLQPIVGFPLEKLDASIKLKQKNNQWIIESQGKLNKIQHSNLTFKGLNWKMNLDNDWRALFQASSINYQPTTSPQQTINAHAPAKPTAKLEQWQFNQAKIALTGNIDNHQIHASFFSDDNQPVNINLEASMLQSPTSAQKITSTNSPNARLSDQQYLWQINKLSAKVPYAAQKLSLIANNISIASDRQEIARLCIDGIGQICVKGFVDGKKWSLDANLDKLDLKAIDAFSKHWDFELPVHIEGEIIGGASISGASQQLESLKVDLESAELLIFAPNWQSRIQQLTISSVKQNDDYLLQSSWHSLGYRFITPEWQSMIASANGQAQLKIGRNFDWYLGFDNPNIEVSLENKLNPPSSLSSFEEPILAKPLLIPQLQLIARRQSNRLDTRINIALTGDDKIDGVFNAHWPITSQSAIQAQLNIAISQLEWLKRIQPQIDHIEANWQQQLLLSGTLSEPEVTGKGKLQIDNFELEEIGLNIQNSQLDLNLTDKRLSLFGILKNNQGQLIIDGYANLIPELTGQLKVNGEKLSLINNQQNRLIISPQITANWQASHLEVTGTISIDEAKVKISGLPQQAKSISSDQLLVNRPASTSTPFSYLVQLNLDTGDNVRLEGFGLTSKVVGKLDAVAQSGKPIKVNGQLTLDEGKFEAYKQLLTIDEGKLLFLGAWDNPGIQFKASRQIEDFTVGIIADGSLTKPRLSLYSIPAMAEENILALLLTGRSLESLTQQEGNALANAAIGLGVESANRIAQKLGGVLGINNLEVTSKTKAESTRVDIGAKLNDRLSIGYGTAIDSNNKMSAGWIIEYQLSKSISFEAVSGEEVSASVSYKKQMESFSD